MLPASRDIVREATIIVRHSTVKLRLCTEAEFCDNHPCTIFEFAARRLLEPAAVVSQNAKQLRTIML